MLVFVFRSLRMRHTSSLRARLRLTFDSIAETCRLSTTLSASRNSAAVASCKLRTCAMPRVLANLALSVSPSLFVHAATTFAHEYILINNLFKQNVLNLLRICTFTTSAGNVSFNVDRLKKFIDTSAQSIGVHAFRLQFTITLCLHFA